MLKNLLFASVLFFGSFFVSNADAAKEIPTSPVNYVLDEAGALGASASQLSALLTEEDRKFGNQILIAVFKSLDGEDHVDYTNRLFKAWNPGQKGKNNGIVLAAFLAEKKIRFEVGYGLEPYLTDAKSKRIIVDFLGPAFREKQYGRGFIEAVGEIQKIIHSDGSNQEPVQRPHKRKLNWVQLAFLVIIFVILNFIDRLKSNTISSTGVHRHYRNDSGWGGFGGGGFGGSGGSSSGGGFSGGGGMSGGGGASGDW